ncbi:MAG: hypothetical protein HY293_01485, partial [Planctomycetes bacterium]|nr:hypothetical protein [Planctomycetota bacterium]
SPPPPPTPISRAVDFLVSRQTPDGLWKSDTTTVLGSGQALTPFVLYALSHAPLETLAPHRAAIDRGLGRLPISGDEYPSYALALSILALRRLGRSTDTGPLELALRARQLTEHNGWSEADPEYGGWDHGAVIPKKPDCRRPDVSVTAFAVEALGGDAKARRFAGRCRAPAGGYFFTPSRLWEHQNKAGTGIGYETATFDALRILGTPPTSDPGLSLPEEWKEALFFYRAFVRSKVRPDPATGSSVLARQQPDGSFRNPAALMKEDDPLIATGLALVTLCLCR